MSALLQKNKTKNRDSNIYPSKISRDLFLNVFAMFFECNKHTCCQLRSSNHILLRSYKENNRK